MNLRYLTVETRVGFWQRWKVLITGRVRVKVRLAEPIAIIEAAELSKV